MFILIKKRVIHGPIKIVYFLTVPRNVKPKCILKPLVITPVMLARKNAGCRCFVQSEFDFYVGAWVYLSLFWFMNEIYVLFVWLGCGKPQTPKNVDVLAPFQGPNILGRIGLHQQASRCRFGKPECISRTEMRAINGLLCFEWIWSLHRIHTPSVHMHTYHMWVRRWVLMCMRSNVCTVPLIQQLRGCQ